MKVSVCMPVYNGEAFIKAAIDSVLEQTFKDFELIIVDNQSSDSTVSIIKSYSDPRIKFFQNSSNIGLIPNWNMALSKASGEYIKLLPADDIIYSKCLELQVAAFDQDIEKALAMVCVRKHIIDENGKVILSRGYSKKKCIVSGISAINKNMRSGGNIIGEGGAVLFRREILAKTGYFNSPLFYVLDIDQWYKILLHGNLYSIPEIQCAFRVSPSSGSTKAKNTQKSDLRIFMKRIYNDKTYQVSWLSYQVGLIQVTLNTIAKKIIYRLIANSAGN